MAKIFFLLMSIQTKENTLKFRIQLHNHCAYSHFNSNDRDGNDASSILIFAKG